MVEICQTAGTTTSLNAKKVKMLQPEEESEAEVRRVDQDNINKFARLNARLHELIDERDLLKVRVQGAKCTIARFMVSLGECRSG